MRFNHIPSTPIPSQSTDPPSPTLVIVNYGWLALVGVQLYQPRDRLPRTCEIINNARFLCATFVLVTMRSGAIAGARARRDIYYYFHLRLILNVGTPQYNVAMQGLDSYIGFRPFSL